MTEPGSPQENTHLRIRREAHGYWHSGRDWFLANWRERRAFRLAGYALGGLLALWLLMWVTVAVVWIVAAAVLALKLGGVF